MRLLLTLIMMAFAGPALAHPGHLTDLAGHDHWVAGAAIGLAILTGIWGVVKGKSKDEEAEDQPELEEEAA